MTYWVPIAIGLLMLAIMLLPVAFLLYAGLIVSRKLQGTHANLLVIGAILLAFASLHPVFNYFGAYLLEAKSIASIIIYTSIIFEGLRIAALVLISIGLIKLSKVVSSGEATK